MDKRFFPSTLLQWLSAVVASTVIISSAYAAVTKYCEFVFSSHYFNILEVISESDDKLNKKITNIDGRLIVVETKLKNIEKTTDKIFNIVYEETHGQNKQRL